MPFEDKMPRRIAPRRPRQLGITPSATSEDEAHARETTEKMDGRPGEYRMIFRAMRLPGLPEDITVGNVLVNQTVGPVWTQRTEIRQSPGWTPVYDKQMQRVPVGAGEDLTACVLPVTLTEDLSRAMEAWHGEVLAAAAILVAIFDERIAQEVIAEDLVILAETGEPVTAADHVMLVRQFQSANRVTRSNRDVLARLGDLDLREPGPTSAAARWYLRAAQAGPTPDAIVFLWVALEALSKPPQPTTRPQKDTDVEWVKAAVRDARLDPDEVTPSVGRLAGLRADVVHRGIEQPDLLREGFYTLEALARLLIRHRLGLRAVWPLRPNQSNLPPPLRRLARLARPKTRWAPPE